MSAVSVAVILQAGCSERRAVSVDVAHHDLPTISTIDAVISPDGNQTATLLLNRKIACTAANDKTKSPILPDPFPGAKCSPILLGWWRNAAVLVHKGCGDGAALWDGKRWTPRPDFAILRRYTLAPDSRHLLIQAPDKRVVIWDLLHGRVSFRAGLIDCGYPMALSSSGAKLAGVCGSSDQDALTCGVWDLRTGHLVWNHEPFHSGPTAVSISPDGSLVAVLGQDSPGEPAEWQVKVFSADMGRLLQVPELDGFAASVAFSVDGKLLAVGCTGGSIDVFDTTSWKTVYRLSYENHNPSFDPAGNSLDTVRNVVFVPGSLQLMTNRGGQIRLWNLDARAQNPERLRHG